MAADTALKKKVKQALVAGFPYARVNVFDGYLTNIHAIVISETFAGVAEPSRQDRVWGALEEALAPGEIVKVSLVLAFAPTEPEASRALDDRVGFQAKD